MNTIPRVASKTDNLNRSRCLLSLAAIQDEMSRTEAGRIGAIHQQAPQGIGFRVQRARAGQAQRHGVRGRLVRLIVNQQHGLASLVSFKIDRP